MTDRHKKQLSSGMVSLTMTLNRYLVDKSQQARKIVKWNFIDPILKEAQALFVNITDMMDGVDSKNKVLRNLYSIQKRSVLVAFLERDNRRKVVNGKRKKHYGFDAHAAAYIDTTCDDLISQVNAFSQSHQPYDRGQDGRTI